MYPKNTLNPNHYSGIAQKAGLFLAISTSFMAYYYFNRIETGFAFNEAAFFLIAIIPLLVAMLMGPRFVIVLAPIYAVTNNVPGRFPGIWNNVADSILLYLIILALFDRQFWTFIKSNKVISVLIFFNLFSVWISFFFGNPSAESDEHFRFGMSMALSICLLAFLVMYSHLSSDRVSIADLQQSMVITWFMVVFYSIPGMLMIFACYGDYFSTENPFANRLIPTGLPQGGSLLGLFAAMGLAVVAYDIDRLDGKYSTSKKIFAVVAIIVCIVAVGLSTSTSAFLAAFSIIFIWITLPPHRKSLPFKVLSALMLILAYFLQSYVNCMCIHLNSIVAVGCPFSTEEVVPDLESSASPEPASLFYSSAARIVEELSGDPHRGALFERGLGHSTNVLNGMGVGGQPYFVQEGQNIVRLHNTVITTWVERGGLGLLAGTALVLWVVWPLIAARDWLTTNDHRRYWVMVLAAMAVFGLGHDIDVSEWFWLLLAGICVRIRTQGNNVLKSS